MKLAAARRPSASAAAGVVLFVVYFATLAPDVTFWDAGEFIAAAHSLGIPHPPGTPLYILLLNVWAKLLPLPYAFATNLMSAAATATAAALTGSFVRRATGSDAMAFCSALIAGAMSSVWLSATESEVYAAALLLGVLMIWAGDRAGRDEDDRSTRWLLLLAYLIALAVPLHLSALVAAPAAIALAAQRSRGVEWGRVGLLAGVLIVAIGVGRVSPWMTGAGALVILVSAVPTRRFANAPAVLAVVALATSALVFLYLRARFDPAINQSDSSTWAGLIETIGRRQYDVAPIWPRSAPAWIQLGNFGQYMDWQIALSLGPTVYPSIARTACTVAFILLGIQGALEHWKLDRRTWFAVAALLLCGSIGVVVYLNLHASPSIGHGILPADVVREARERDYFFVFAFWAWAVWAGIGAVSFVAENFRRPAWAAAFVALLPVVLNWRAVTRRTEPEASLPRTFATMLLESTPPSGVLLVMGDNDSYPLWYAQQVRGLRRDVRIITVPLLPTEWYRRQIAKRFGLLDSAGVRGYNGSFAKAVEIAARARAAGHPIAAGPLMTAAERERVSRSWIARGVVYVEGALASSATAPADGSSGRPEVVIDTAATRHAAERVEQLLGSKVPRDAIDPVNRFFRRVLDCPRRLREFALDRDSTRLDSACNYR